MLQDAMKSMFWNIVGFLSPAQWLVLAVSISAFISFTVNLPWLVLGALKAIFSPFRKDEDGKERLGLAAGLAAVVLVLCGYIYRHWDHPEVRTEVRTVVEKVPVEVVVHHTPRPINFSFPPIKLPDFSGWLSNLKLPKLPAPPVVDASWAEREKKLLAENARLNELATRLAIRLKNIDASAAMDRWMAEQWRQLEVDEEREALVREEYRRRMNTPPGGIVLPPGSRLVR